VAIAAAACALPPLAGAAIPTGNRIVNPGAETRTDGVFTDYDCPVSWSCPLGYPTAVYYGTNVFPSSAESARIAGQTSFFAGGLDSGQPNQNRAILKQTISVAGFGPELYAGNVRATVSGCLGGFGSQEDAADLTLYRTSDAAITIVAGTSKVTAADRGNVTKLLPKSVSATIPGETTGLFVQVDMDRAPGAGSSYNDAYADNLSLTLGPAGLGDPPAVSCTDVDRDGVDGNRDNCPATANANQANTDGDGSGDACDTDDDNDGVPDAQDAFPLARGESADSDGDGTGDNADPDDDNDGVPDGEDAFPLAAGESADTDRDGLGDNADTDDDNDGVPDAADAYPKDVLRHLAEATGGPDLLNGDSADNLICGLGGNDVIDGLAGNDTLFGDGCNDRSRRLFGAQAVSEGDDTISGSDGADTLYGAGGKDKLRGGGGNDWLFGGGGNDSLSGEDGKDALDGGKGNDKLTGGRDVNSYKGGSGDDAISARNKKKDTIDCGAGKKDKATVDKIDKVKGCEKVSRK
jgi:Ca2+-binding RTX toxin-like protein